jgi:hypothetical protein
VFRTFLSSFHSGNALLVSPASDPALDRRTDSGAGDETGLPIVSRRPNDQHPAVAEGVAGQKLRLVDRVFALRHHGAVEPGARRADPFAALDCCRDGCQEPIAVSETNFEDNYPPVGKGRSL